jgi:hypothetical protein
MISLQFGYIVHSKIDTDMDSRDDVRISFVGRLESRRNVALFELILCQQLSSVRILVFLFTFSNLLSFVVSTSLNRRSKVRTVIMN